MIYVLWATGGGHIAQWAHRYIVGGKIENA